MKSIRSKLNRLLKLSVALVFYLCTEVRNAIGRSAKRTPSPTCVVLHYHSIRPEHRLLFAAQMDALKRLTTPIPADCKTPLAAGQHYAIVTFDDGFSSVVENAVPELVRRRIPATIFVVSDLLGATPTWDSLGHDYILREQLISAEQLQGLPADLIRVGSHGLSHQFLPSVSEEQARNELSESRKKLSDILSTEITLFSFPYGAFNNRLIELCRAAGYKRAFTILPSLALKDPQELVTGRIAVEPTDWALEFRLKLLGAYRWLPSAFALKQVLFSFLSIKQKAEHAPEENRIMRTREWL